MSNKIILKKSSVANKAPTTSDLTYGELALNYNDSKLYIKTATNEIFDIGAGFVKDTGEPTGITSVSESSLSFNASTRTFTITPTGASFSFYQKGTKFVKTVAETLVIPNVTDTYYIYYNAAGSLAYRTGHYVFETDAPVATVYWNATAGSAPYFADERHGIALDWQTHEYLHRTRGAVLASGFEASNYIVGGDGSLDAHVQFDLANGTFFDEDLQVDVTHSNTPTANTWQQDLQGPARIPMLYHSGTSWVIDAPTNYPLKRNSTLPQYNRNTGGVWDTAEVQNKNYATTWIVATNNLNYPIVGIIGQSYSDNSGQAEAVTFADLDLTGFPVAEFRPLYKLIFKCSTGYSNTPKARLESIWDIRLIQTTTVSNGVTTDHGSLSGLGDDDHLQYVHISTARTISANHTFSGNVAFTGSVDLPNSGVTAGAYGSSTAIPVITVNADGLVTSVSTQNIPALSAALNIKDDANTGDAIVLGSDTLHIAGGVGLTSVVTDNKVTVNLDDTAVTAGSYGSASAVPVITVDAQGRITAASTTNVAGVSGVAYNGTSGVITVSTSAGTDFTVDIGVGSGDSPSFTAVSAGTVSGTTKVSTNVVEFTNSVVRSDTATTTSTVANQAILSVDATVYRTAEFLIQASNNTNGYFQTNKIIVVHNGTDANYSDYAMVAVGGAVATYSVDYNGGNVRLLTTPASAASTVFKISSTLIKV